MDAPLAPAKGGGQGVGLSTHGNGVKILTIVERQGLPRSVSTHAAKHHAVTWVALRGDFSMLEAKPTICLARGRRTVMSGMRACGPRGWT